MTTTTTKPPVLRRATVPPPPQSMRLLTLQLMPMEPHQLRSTEHPLMTAPALVPEITTTMTDLPLLRSLTVLRLRKPTVPQLRLMMLTEPPPPTKRRRRRLSDAAVVDSLAGDLPPGGPLPGGLPPGGQLLPRDQPPTGDQPRLAVLAGS